MTGGPGGAAGAAGRGAARMRGGARRLPGGPPGRGQRRTYQWGFPGRRGGLRRGGGSLHALPGNHPGAQAIPAGPDKCGSSSSLHPADGELLLLPWVGHASLSGMGACFRQHLLLLRTLCCCCCTVCACQPVYKKKHFLLGRHSSCRSCTALLPWRRVYTRLTQGL